MKLILVIPMLTLVLVGCSGGDDGWASLDVVVDAAEDGQYLQIQSDGTLRWVSWPPVTASPTPTPYIDPCLYDPTCGWGNATILILTEQQKNGDRWYFRSPWNEGEKAIVKVLPTEESTSD